MKKQAVFVLSFALLLSGCATGRMGNPGAIVAGASIGGTLGGAVGGLVGDNHYGWRGSYRGSAIGTIVGTIAGAAIGSAMTAPKAPDEYAYIPQVKNDESRQNQRPLVKKSFAQLRICNIRFIDDGRRQSITAGESSKVIFEIMNDGKAPVHNVVPIVEQVSELKHIGISPSVMVEEILPGGGIRYTATIYAGSKLKNGEATIRVAVSDENAVICDSQEFTIPTRSRE